MAKSARIPVGADPATYRRGAKNEKHLRAVAVQAHFDRMTPEEKAADREERAVYSEHMAVWRKEFDELGPMQANELLVQRRAQYRAFTKLVDREARVAVEGDTDMNHDNVEVAE